VVLPPEHLESTRLLCNGEPLALFVQPIAGELRMLANWPLSGTGRYRLYLESIGFEEEREIELTPEKLTFEEYGEMIADLQTSLPASVAIALQRGGALAGLELRPPGESTLATELSRLRRAVRGDAGSSGLVATLPAIARDPHRVLTKTERWVENGQVRRLEPLGLISALRKPGNLDTTTQLPLHVPDVRVEHSVDVYENRLLRSYHDQVAGRLRRLGAALEARKMLSALVEVEELIGDLSRERLGASFLDEVTCLTHVPTRVTMILLKRPEYRSMLESYLRFRRSAYVQLEEPALEAPLENLPHLYELWGTLIVIRTLIDVAVSTHGYEVHSQRLARHIDGGVYLNVLADGAPAVELRHPQTHAYVALIPQRRYVPGGPRLHSISFSQIPDITVLIQRGHRRPRLYLFDPKYKLHSEATDVSDGRPKKIDIDTMHAYRDAIRDERQQRVVANAAILYPGLEMRYGDGIEALRARPDQPAGLEERVREVLTAGLEPWASRES
jgi:predicted component of viral defense system (DUF524 family)